MINDLREAVVKPVFGYKGKASSGSGMENAGA
jgi:hypothetical protein